MSRIKLRAWYKDVMWYDVGVFEEGVYVWSDLDLCPIPLHDKEDEEKIGLPSVTQFTGLLDKNGKELWGGDIVELEKNFPLNPVEILEVAHGRWCYVLKRRDGIQVSSLDTITVLNVKILGNKFENPELMEANQ